MDVCMYITARFGLETHFVDILVFFRATVSIEEVKMPHIIYVSLSLTFLNSQFESFNMISILKCAWRPNYIFF